MSGWMLVPDTSDGGACEQPTMQNMAAAIERHEHSGKKEILAPANIAGGYSPPLGEEILALLILLNCTAKWCGNFWQVRSSKHERPVHVSGGASFDEWRTELNKFSVGDHRPAIGP